jgi:hypothetical protein
VEALSAANSGGGSWEGGWRVKELAGAAVVVERDGLELWARGEDCRGAAGEPLAPGCLVALRFPKEHLGLSPGFYMALGDRPIPTDGSETVLRWYWNLTADGAVPLLRDVTAQLNGSGAAFRLKVVRDPAHFGRCDATVVYTLRSEYPFVAALFARLYPDVRPFLKPQTPALTRALAPGLGLAEDPGPADSFGLHRCRLLAEGLVRAFEQGRHALEERRAVVAACFAERGYTLQAPYLNPNSTDDYAFEPGLPVSGAPPQEARPREESHRAAGPEDFLAAAVRIGERLERAAVWHAGLCNWLGAVPVEQSRRNGRGLTYSALGPELYSGTSGVAVFLAALSSVTAAPGIRRAALGAIRQALSRADALSAAEALGLYTGWIGMALAAAHVAVLLGEEPLLGRAEGLVRRAADVSRDHAEADVLSGRAGAVAGLLGLHALRRDDFLLDFAGRLAAELVQSAHHSKAGCSWKAVGYPTHRNLTGFSHGAAGIGWALLELYGVTGDARWRAAAESAFDYERHWFDAGAGNWPDFRESPAAGVRSFPCMTYWCHGAPGIALSRLRAFQLLNDAACREEASLAVRTTRAAVERALRSRGENFSLCHGLAGNAEVLCFGALVLEEQAPAAAALEVARLGLAIHAGPGQTWPCGTGAGETPSLMLGLAGIGYFYLRLHTPTLPPVLLPVPTTPIPRRT